jgi:hypothetical protein
LHPAAQYCSIGFEVLLHKIDRQQEKANTHTRTRKLTKKTQQQKTQMEPCKYNHMQENSTKTAKQIPSGI